MADCEVTSSRMLHSMVSGKYALIALRAECVSALSVDLHGLGLTVAESLPVRRPFTNNSTLLLSVPPTRVRVVWPGIMHRYLAPAYREWGAVYPDRAI